MSAIPSPWVPTLPDNAPFTPAQRAWLNGFFAGLVGARVQAAAAAGAGAAVAAGAPAPAVAAEDFPWHDASLSLDERLKLAEGRPVERQLMAAMAQLDCGACGYLCQTYSEAIAAGTEKDFTKCAPGGKDTARKLKELLAARGTMPAAVEVRVKGAPAKAEKAAVKPGQDRRNPVSARLLKCAPLNKDGSSKDTRFVSFDLRNSGLVYKAGDSLGVYPENCPDTVQWVLEALGASGAEHVRTADGTRLSLHEALLRHYDLKKCPPALVELLAASAKEQVHADALRLMLADDGPGVPEGHEVLDLLLEYRSAKPDAQAFVAALSSLQPRLYSISSSPLAHPEEVHLTVGVVRYLNGRGRQCKGTASTFLADRVRPGQKVRVYVQPSHGFAPPPDGDVPMVMVGPGTGIAPFRAFLQERKAAGAKGRNWLLFGDQRRAFDFLYEDELTTYQREGLLTRLDTAFSRDQGAKCYVQHRMLESAGELWAWLRAGAHFYVCGDAKRMAADVDAALKQVVAEQGRMSPEAAKAYVGELAKAKRYQRDVY